MMLLQLAYIAVCLVGIVAIIALQQGRYRAACGCRWWLLSALAVGLAYEALEAWKWGVPGWPASRWITMPTLSASLTWSAFDDWRERRGARR